MQLVQDPHAASAEEVLRALRYKPDGLSRSEVAERLKSYGPNSLPEPRLSSVATYFLRQFLSPLIYILLLAAAVSLMLGEWQDSVFIFAVLIINAIIGTVQEYSAERSAEALRSLVRIKARVIRDGKSTKSMPKSWSLAT